jgi:hypothetical protein
MHLEVTKVLTVLWSYFVFNLHPDWKFGEVSKINTLIKSAWILGFIYIILHKCMIKHRRNTNNLGTVCLRITDDKIGKLVCPSLLLGTRLSSGNCGIRQWNSYLFQNQVSSPCLLPVSWLPGPWASCLKTQVNLFSTDHFVLDQFDKIEPTPKFVPSLVNLA